MLLRRASSLAARQRLAVDRGRAFRCSNPMTSSRGNIRCGRPGERSSSRTCRLFPAHARGPRGSPPSYEMCMRLRSIEYGFFNVAETGISVLLCVGDAVRFGSGCPSSSPATGAITEQLGRQRSKRQLESHLVVALAGSAVRDGVAARLPCHFRPGPWRSTGGRAPCRAGRCPRRSPLPGSPETRSRGRTPRGRSRTTQSMAPVSRAFSGSPASSSS